MLQTPLTFNSDASQFQLIKDSNSIPDKSIYDNTSIRHVNHCVIYVSALSGLLAVMAQSSLPVPLNQYLAY